MMEYKLPLEALVSAIKFLFDQLEMPAKRRKHWFDDHIEPSYRQLTEIHNDYTRSFARVLDALQKKRDLNEAVRLLKADRPNCLLDRQEVKANLLALLRYRMDRERKPQVVLTFYDYVTSIDAYLNSASPIPSNETWYRYFIDEFSRLVKQGEDPFTYSYEGCAQGINAPKLAIEELLQAMENMPNAFQRVQNNYAKLRVQCLSNI